MEITDWEQNPQASLKYLLQGTSNSRTNFIRKNQKTADPVFSDTRTLSPASQSRNSMIRGGALSPCVPISAGKWDQSVQFPVDSESSNDCDISSPTRPDEEDRSKDIFTSTFTNTTAVSHVDPLTNTVENVDQRGPVGPKRQLGSSCNISVSNHQPQLRKDFGETPEPPSMSRLGKPKRNLTAKNSKSPKGRFKLINNKTEVIPSEDRQLWSRSPNRAKRMALSPRSRASVELHMQRQLKAKQLKLQEEAEKKRNEEKWEIRWSVERQKLNRRNQEMLKGRVVNRTRRTSPNAHLQDGGRTWREDTNSAIDLLSVSHNAKIKMKQKSDRLVQQRFVKEWNFVTEEVFGCSPSTLTEPRINEDEFEFILDRMWFLKSSEELKKLDAAFFTRSYMVGLSPSEQQQCLVGTAFELLNPYRPSEQLPPEPHVQTPFQIHMFNKAEKKRKNTINLKNLETFVRVLLNVREDKNLLGSSRSSGDLKSMTMINGTDKVPYGRLAPHQKHYRSVERLDRKPLFTKQDLSRAQRNDSLSPDTREERNNFMNQDITEEQKTEHKQDGGIQFESNPPTNGTTTPNLKEPSQINSPSERRLKEEDQMPITAESANENPLSDTQSSTTKQGNEPSPLQDQMPVSDFRDAPELFRQFIFNRQYKTHDNQLKLTEGRHNSKQETFQPKISRKSQNLAFKQMKKAEQYQQEVNDFFRSLKMESFAVNCDGDQVRLAQPQKDMFDNSEDNSEDNTYGLTTKPKPSVAIMNDDERLKEPQIKVEFEILEKLEQDVQMLRQKAQDMEPKQNFKNKQRLLTPAPDTQNSFGIGLGMYDVQEESCEESFEQTDSRAGTLKSCKRKPVIMEELQQDPYSLGEESHSEAVEWKPEADTENESRRQSLVQFQKRLSQKSNNSRRFSGYLQNRSENEMNFEDDDQLLEEIRLSNFKEVDILGSSKSIRIRKHLNRAQDYAERRQISSKTGKRQDSFHRIKNYSKTSSQTKRISIHSADLKSFHNAQTKQQNAYYQNCFKFDTPARESIDPMSLNQTILTQDQRSRDSSAYNLNISRQIKSGNSAQRKTNILLTSLGTEEPNTMGSSLAPLRYGSHQVPSSTVPSLEAEKVIAFANSITSDKQRIFYGTHGLEMKNRVGQMTQGRRADKHLFNKTLEDTKGKKHIRLKKEAIKEITLTKNPTIQDLKHQLDKHHTHLSPFYKNTNITKVTEKDIVSGVQSMKFPEVNLSQLNIPTDQANLTFKRVMAKRMMDQLTHTADQNDEVPQLIAQTTDENNQELVLLKRQFEDNEAEIIHDLYNEHFKPKAVRDAMTSKAISAKKNEMDSIQSSTRQQVALEDQTERTGDIVQPGPEVKGYAKTLADEIKYVQYIPKAARGSIEDVVNKIYTNGDFTKRQSAPTSQLERPIEEPEIETQQTKAASLSSPHKYEYNPKCYKTHRHARGCANSKETDIAQLQTNAFRYLVLQKPDFEPTGFAPNQTCRASFFPKARLPDELLSKIEVSLKFQRQMFIPDRILRGRPLTTNNAKSRFTKFMPLIQPSHYATVESVARNSVSDEMQQKTLNDIREISKINQAIFEENLKTESRKNLSSNKASKQAINEDIAWGANKQDRQIKVKNSDYGYSDLTGRRSAAKSSLKDHRDSDRLKMQSIGTTEQAENERLMQHQEITYSSVPSQDKLIEINSSSEKGSSHHLVEKSEGTQEMPALVINEGSVSSQEQPDHTRDQNQDMCITPKLQDSFGRKEVQTQRKPVISNQHQTFQETRKMSPDAQDFAAYASQGVPQTQNNLNQDLEGRRSSERYMMIDGSEQQDPPTADSRTATKTLLQSVNNRGMSENDSGADLYQKGCLSEARTFSVVSENQNPTQEPRFVVVFSQKNQNRQQVLYKNKHGNAIAMTNSGKNYLRPTVQNIGSQYPTSGSGQSSIHKRTLTEDRSINHDRDHQFGRIANQGPLGQAGAKSAELKALLSRGLRDKDDRSAKQKVTIQKRGRNQQGVQPNWISPFSHLKACSQNKRRNLNLNVCSNMERSYNVNHCLSLNSQLKPDKLYANLFKTGDTMRI